VASAPTDNGRVEVSIQWTEARRPPDALSRFLSSQMFTIEAQGFRVVSQRSRSVSFRRRRLFRRDQRFTVTVTAGKAGGSIVKVEGSVRRKLESAFGESGDRNGSKADDLAEMQDELRRVYELVGKPSAFLEAKGKVTLLADCLATERGIDGDEALRLAYDRSLAEHREYLAAKGISPMP
jgi:hypothetical protein